VIEHLGGSSSSIVPGSRVLRTKASVRRSCAPGRPLTPLAELAQRSYALRWAIRAVSPTNADLHEVSGGHIPNATDRTTSRARNEGSARTELIEAQSIRLLAECTHNLMPAASSTAVSSTMSGGLIG
jgi:hypothetical protein